MHTRLIDKMIKHLRSNLSVEQKKLIWKFLNFLPYKPNLNFLALKHGTDKYGHGYIEFYKKHFQTFRKKKLNILEIGVGGYDVPRKGGDSLRMWKDYFPNSNIFAIDIYDKSALQEKRIKIFRGSQNDPEFLLSVASQIGNIDIIIDDGSHQNAHVITTFKTLFPCLADNGYYVIEDIHTSYWPRYGGNWKNLSEAITSISTVKTLIDGLNYQFIPNRNAFYTDDKIKSIHFYPKIVFIFKGMNRCEIPEYVLRELALS